MENKKKTLIITGASGFIGTNFIERYKEKYNIVPVDLLKMKQVGHTWGRQFRLWKPRTTHRSAAKSVPCS